MSVALEVVVALLRVATGRDVAGLDLLGGRITLVEVPGGLQPLDQVEVDVGALRLAVRRVRAADVDALVPVDVQPAQAVEELQEALLGVARGIRVLDAKNRVCRPCVARRPS